VNIFRSSGAGRSVRRVDYESEGSLSPQDGCETTRTLDRRVFGSQSDVAVQCQPVSNLEPKKILPVPSIGALPKTRVLQVSFRFAVVKS